MDANQYVRIIINAGAGNLGVVLYGPAQQKLTETVCREAVPMRISLLAPSPAAYVLDLRSLETEAFAGQYEITVETARPATAADGTAVLAERALTRGRDPGVLAAARVLAWQVNDWRGLAADHGR